MADSSSEVQQLRQNADNLAQCLHALLLRIEQLEHKETPALPAAEENNDHNVQVVCTDSVSVDPDTGLKKRTIVTERVLTTKTYQALALDPSQRLENGTNGHLLSPSYQSRAVQVEASSLGELDVERIAGQLVVTKVAPDASHGVHPGDTIVEVDGRPVSTKDDLHNLRGQVTVTLVPATLHQAPALFYRVNGDYDSEEDANQICKGLVIHVRRGDVVQVLSRDDAWLQARKVNDLSRVGYLPARLQMEKVAMLTPYGRRVLVLLGAPGVGRRTLKSQLLRTRPAHFATVVPYTSRARRKGEQEGREYHFTTKEHLLKKIRDGDLIEWGELDGQLYGTCASSVREVTRSGRVCVLDCAPQSLNYLYNGEFMPFVVLIKPPPFEEFRQLNASRQNKKEDLQLKRSCEESAALENGPHAALVHLSITNRNLDVAFKRLDDALEQLRRETQWVPESWMC